MAPDSGTPFADCSSASNTGVLSKRGMQHQTTWAVASTSALMAQLPIIARSSDAACAFEIAGRSCSCCLGAFGC